MITLELCIQENITATWWLTKHISGSDSATSDLIYVLPFALIIFQFPICLMYDDNQGCKQHFPQEICNEIWYDKNIKSQIIKKKKRGKNRFLNVEYSPFHNSRLSKLFKKFIQIIHANVMIPKFKLKLHFKYIWDVYQIQWHLIVQ